MSDYFNNASGNSTDEPLDGGATPDIPSEPIQIEWYQKDQPTNQNEEHLDDTGRNNTEQNTTTADALPKPEALTDPTQTTMRVDPASTTALATTPSTTSTTTSWIVPPSYDNDMETPPPTWTDRPTIYDDDAYLTAPTTYAIIVRALAASIFTILCMCRCLCHPDCRRGYRPVVQQAPPPS